MRKGSTPADLRLVARLRAVFLRAVFLRAVFLRAASRRRDNHPTDLLPMVQAQAGILRLPVQKKIRIDPATRPIRAFSLAPSAAGGTTDWSCSQ
jgi:hypothetical protein